MDRIEQAVILAAGEGQRLRPFTALKPKVMIPIANKPIIQYVVEALVKNGIRQVVVVVGYRKEQVIDFFGSGGQFGAEMVYLTQEQQLGTAHALSQAREVAEDKFLVLPGDNIIESGAIADLVTVKPNSILIKEQENVSKYGVVTLRQGKVADIVEKPREAGSNLVNTGIYALSKEVFEFVEGELDLPAALRRMIAHHPLRALEAKGTWLDVVYPWDILQLNDLALHQIPAQIGGTIEQGVIISGAVSIGKDTVIRSNSYIMGPALIGEGCQIGPGAYILPATSIGDNVYISPFTQIKNSVIGNNSHIGPNCTIQDSIIDRGCQLKGHIVARSDETEVKVDGEHHWVQIGAMLGEYCTLEDNVIIQPGVKIGNHARIKALKLIGENVPDEGLVV